MPVESEADRRKRIRLHGSDIVQPVASGMCFGVALSTIIVFIRERRST